MIPSGLCFLLHVNQVTFSYGCSGPGFPKYVKNNKYVIVFKYVSRYWWIDAYNENFNLRIRQSPS